MSWNDFLDYRDGKLYWKRPVNEKSRVEIGAEAGSLESSTGRYSICVARKRTLRSRVVWEIHNGPIPAGMEIDHADRDKTNDNINNLRLATRSENNTNRQGKTAKSGYRGVEGLGKRWRAVLNRKRIGTYDSPEIAAIMYNHAAFQKFGGFACLNEVVL